MGASSAPCLIPGEIWVHGGCPQHPAPCPASPPPHLTQQKGKSEFERLFFFFLLCKRVCPEFLLLLHIFPSIMFSSVLIKFSSEVVIFTGCQLHTASLASSPTNHGSNGFTICTWGLAACVTSVELTWKKKKIARTRIAQQFSPDGEESLYVGKWRRQKHAAVNSASVEQEIKEY